MTKDYNKERTRHVSIENSAVGAVFLPDIGSKMVELTNLRTGRQFMLRGNGVRGNGRPVSPGEVFTEVDAYGFDECFPTVAESLGFPDHGEVWSRPWDAEVHSDEILFSVEGSDGKYVLEKKVRLVDNTLLLDYRACNCSREPFSFIWSAHPLLNVSEGVRVMLPVKNGSVELDWVSDEGVGKSGDRLPWPYLSVSDRRVDYSEVQSPALGRALKCYVDALAEGHVGVYYPETDEVFLMAFDVSQIPYLGLWLCYGGWPVRADQKNLTVALEPCCGRPDVLAEAMRRGECPTLSPGASKSWSLEISVGRGMPSFFAGYETKPLHNE